VHGSHAPSWWDVFGGFDKGMHISAIVEAFGVSIQPNVIFVGDE